MEDYYQDLEIPKDVQASSEDYKDSGFVMAPLLFPLSKGWASPQELRYQYFFSVTCPQYPKFHQGYWKILRSRVKEVAQGAWKSVLVFTGPLFLSEDMKVTYPVIGPGKISVPTHFFLAIFPSEKLSDAEVYIVPTQNIDTKRALESFKVSAAEFQGMSGILLPENMSDYFSSPIPPRM